MRGENCLNKAINDKVVSIIIIIRYIFEVVAATVHSLHIICLIHRELVIRHLA